MNETVNEGYLASFLLFSNRKTKLLLLLAASFPSQRLLLLLWHFRVLGLFCLWKKKSKQIHSQGVHVRICGVCLSFQLAFPHVKSVNLRGLSPAGRELCLWYIVTLNQTSLGCSFWLLPPSTEEEVKEIHHETCSWCRWHTNMPLFCFFYTLTGPFIRYTSLVLDWTHLAFKLP